MDKGTGSAVEKQHPLSGRASPQSSGLRSGHKTESIPSHGLVKEAVSSSDFFFIASQQAARFPHVFQCRPGQKKPEFFQLIHKREFGAGRVCDAMKFCSSVESVESVARTILIFKCDPRLEGPIYAVASSNRIGHVYEMAFVLLLIATNLDGLSGNSTAVACQFLIKVRRLLLEARASNEVKEIFDLRSAIF